MSAPVSTAASRKPLFCPKAHKKAGPNQPGQIFNVYLFCFLFDRLYTARQFGDYLTVWSTITFCQNKRMRIPSTKQLKESPRNHRGGIATASPVIPQTTPTKTAARPVNGINTWYFIGCRAKMVKYPPVATAMAYPTRTTYSTNGEFGR